MTHPPGAVVVGDSWLNLVARGSFVYDEGDPHIPTVDVKELTARPGGSLQIAKHISTLGRRAQGLCEVGEDSAGLSLVALTKDLIDLWPRIYTSRRETVIRHTTRGNGAPTLTCVSNKHARRTGRGMFLADIAQAFVQAQVGVAVLFDWGDDTLDYETTATVMATAKRMQAFSIVVTRGKRVNPQVHGGATVLVVPAVDAVSLVTHQNWLHPGLTTDLQTMDYEVVAKHLRELVGATAAVLVHGNGMLTYADNVIGGTLLHLPGLDGNLVIMVEHAVAALAIAALERTSMPEALVFAQEAMYVARHPDYRGDLPRTATDDRRMERIAMGQETNACHQDAAIAVVRRWRARNYRVAVIDGTFDTFHSGHQHLLAAAAGAAQYVVAIVKSEGNTPLAARIAALQTSRLISLVVWSSDVDRTISDMRPTFLFKGEEYRTQAVPGADEVCKHGGDVRFVPM